MRITELLDKRSISLSGAPKNKNEALDQMVAGRGAGQPDFFDCSA